tara:strand:+ start:2097 stop:2345 length:249 start_codon:yes stop_codon:yes gene_type:complete
MRKLGKHQSLIMESLKKGKHIRSEICGWLFNHKKMRVETEDRLWATGELIEVRVEGKRASQCKIIHKTHFDPEVHTITKEPS